MTELTEDESQFHISLFRGMQHHLKQILAWKENLDNLNRNVTAMIVMINEPFKQFVFG